MEQRIDNAVALQFVLSERVHGMGSARTYIRLHVSKVDATGL